MIKTKQIKTAKATILVVDGLPEDANRFKFFNDEEPYLSYFVGSETFREYNIPSGKWQSVGFLDKIPEKDAQKLVDELGNHVMLQGIFYHNYLHEESMFDTATESLCSLVAANVKLENQYGDCPIPVDYEDDPFGMASAVRSQKIGKWRAEEEKVFTNPYLFRKIG